MRKKLHPGGLSGTYSIGLRLASLVCLLLLLVMSGAQAMHVHDNWTPSPDHRQAALLEAGSQSPSSEAACPICVAMHSALNVAATAHAEVFTTVECKLPGMTGRIAQALQDFSLFSRPPPNA